MANKLSIDTGKLTELAGAIETIAGPLGAVDESLVGGLGSSGLPESQELAAKVPDVLRKLAQWKLGFHGSVEFDSQFTAAAAGKLDGVDGHNAAAITAAVHKAHDAVPVAQPNSGGAS